MKILNFRIIKESEYLELLWQNKSLENENRDRISQIRSQNEVNSALQSEINTIRTSYIALEFTIDNYKAKMKVATDLLSIYDNKLKNILLKFQD